jgi:xanthine dehydrogenase YagR molybdenum-binding subunit
LHCAGGWRAGCELPDAGGRAACKSVTTVEGIGVKGLHAVLKAFMVHDALQCEFCTPGFIVETAAFCDRSRLA